MTMRTKDSTIQRFNAIPWHDSKLLSLAFYRENSHEVVKISLALLEEQGSLKPAVLIFPGSSYIRLIVDLEGKSQCSDDISGANCSAESDWLRTLSAENPYDNFEGVLHFKIELIPPGGEIDILAKDFTLTAGTGIDS